MELKQLMKGAEPKADSISKMSQNTTPEVKALSSETADHQQAARNKQIAEACQHAKPLDPNKLK